MSDHARRPALHVPGTTTHTLSPLDGHPRHEGTLRFLKSGAGAPLVLLHTVRTQAEHFHRLIPLVSQHHTVYALDLPGMGGSEIVPGRRTASPTCAPPSPGSWSTSTSTTSRWSGSPWAQCLR